MSKKEQRNVFRMYSQESIGLYIRDLSNAYKNEINQESDDYIKKINEDEYAKYLTGKYLIDTPLLDFNNIEASTGIKMIRAEDFPPQFMTWKGEIYEKSIIIIHIPYEGDIELLRYNNGINHSRTFEIFIEDGSLCFELIDFNNDLELINKNRQIITDNIKTLSSEIIVEINRYNNNLEANIKNLIEFRKAKIERIVQFLGLPIKKRQDLSSSYEIPTPQTKKNISLKPQLTDINGNVEYILDDNIYLDILQVIHDYGKGFEQYPSISKGKDEEEIRDHFLFVLQPRYNWATTGEAFNKRGKTDILIKYDKTVIFIAECKFWHGQEAYLATINQLFDRYLTWRNSKAAIIIFVKNKNFSSVISEVKKATPKHKNFVEFVDEKDDTWLNYVFHINDNSSRKVKLAVLLFHIPQFETQK